MTAPVPGLGPGARPPRPSTLHALPATLLSRFPRWAKILRDLWSHKSRSLLVVLSIAIGVFAIGVIAGTQAILGQQFTGTYLATHPAHATLGVSDFDEGLVDTVARMPEVDDASARFGLALLARRNGEGDWQDLTLYARPDMDTLRINKVEPEAGMWPPAKEGIVLERNSLPLLGVQLGDTVQIDLGDNRLRDVPVTGVVHDINLPPARFAGRTFGYISFDTLDHWGYPRSFNELMLTVAGQQDSKPHIAAVVEQVKDKVEKAGYRSLSVRIPDPGQAPVQEILDALFIILGVLGALSLLLSGFLVVNTINATLAQQTRQVAVMKAIGARTGQIVSLYLGMALIYGVIALAIALPLGTWGAYALSRFASGFLNFDVIYHGMPPKVVLLQAAVGLLLPLAAAAVPVWNGTKITVREALASYGLGKGRFGRGSVDQFLLALQRFLPFFTRPVMLSLRNTFRRKARLTLTMVTLTLGGAIFIAVFSVRDSLDSTLALANRYDNFDVTIEFDRPYRAEQIREEALKVPGVVAVETWGSGSAVRERPDGSESDRIRLRAPQTDSTMIQPNILDGRWLLPDDETAAVINSNLLDEEPDLAVGQTLTLKEGDKEREWTVVGIVHSVLGAPTAYVNFDTYAGLTGTSGRAGDARLAISPDDPSSQKRLAKALEAHFEAAGYQVAGTGTKVEDVESIELRFSILVTFLLVMALLIAAVGGMGLMGTMSINVLERTREIGVLRAIGAATAAVMQIVLVEGLLIGLISWAQGVFFGWPIGKLMSDAIGKAFVDSPLVYHYSLQGAALWLAVALLISSLASFIPARNAARLTVREVLAYE